MSTRSPPWAMTCTLSLMIFMWVTLPQAAFGLETVHEGYIPRQATPPPSTNSSGSDLLCTPFGRCEPCPPDAMNEPFCQPFGNRRLMHCINTTFTLAPPPPPDHDHGAPGGDPPPGRLTALHPDGDILAWESCGRIVQKERADFYEFIACNVVFALIALGVLFFRSRRMQMNQARQLAARIGLIRGDNGRVIRP